MLSGHRPGPDGEDGHGRQRPCSRCAAHTGDQRSRAVHHGSWTTASIDCIVFDPPYHNNINYAELSDFFYVWLKRTAGYVFPEYFTEHLTDKTNEAIASPARFRAQASRS